MLKGGGVKMIENLKSMPPCCKEQISNVFDESPLPPFRLAKVTTPLLAPFRYSILGFASFLGMQIRIGCVRKRLDQV